MKKKVLSMLLVAAMTVTALTGCGGSSSGGSASSGGSSAGGGAELNLIIASNQTSEDNPYSDFVKIS